MIDDSDKRNLKSEFSVDELLAQSGFATDKYKDKSNDLPQKSWSISDIDALLASGNSSGSRCESSSDFQKGDEPLPPVSDVFVSSLFKKNDETIGKDSLNSPLVKNDSSALPTAQREDLHASQNTDSQVPACDIEKTIVMDLPIKSTALSNSETRKLKPCEFPAKDQSKSEDFQEDSPLWCDEDFADGSDIKENRKITGSQMESSKIRDRFINVLTLEKTSEFDVLNRNEPIERPGVILGKSDFSKTADLSALPLVMPAEDALRSSKSQCESTDIRGSAQIIEKNDGEVVEGQIRLHGFGAEEDPQKIDEHFAEKQLIEKRRQTAKSFKLFDIPVDYDRETNDKEGDPLAELGDDENSKNPDLPLYSQSVQEYVYPSDKNAVGKELQGRRRRGVIKTVALVGLEIVLLISFAVPMLMKALELETPEFLNPVFIFSIVSFIILVIAGAICSADLFNGFKRLFSLKASADTAATLAVVAAFVQNIIVMFSPTAINNNTGVFSLAAIMVLILNSIARSNDNARVMENFRFCAVTGANSLHNVSEFDDEKETFEIGRSLLMGTPEIRLSRKIKFPSNFLAHSFEWNVTDDICKILIPCSTVAGLIVACISLVKTNNLVNAFSVLSAAMTIAAPAGILLASSVALHKASQSLNADGGMVSGLAAAEDCGKINAVVVDGANLFKQGQCNLHGMKDYKNVRIDDVVLYTAAMVINSGGPLTEIFDKVITNSRELLPAVRSLGYEDKMGLSALIHKQKVLFGNRSLLVNHGVEVPGEMAETKYCHDGRRVLYLAIANKLAAMFVVSYSFDTALTPYLKYLENSGINILVRNCDPNITESLLNSEFGLQRGTVRLLNPNSGRIFKRSSLQEYDCDEATVLNDGRVKSFLHSIATAAMLGFSSRVMSIVQAIGAGVGLLMLLIFVLVGAFDKINALWIIAYQLVWVLLTFLSGLVRKLKDSAN